MEKSKEEIILEYIRNAYRRNSGILVVEDEEIVERIRDIAEKQISKKPVIKHLEAVGEEPYIKLKCPNCHSRHSLGEVYDKYCKICGQKIDWS